MSNMGFVGVVSLAAIAGGTGSVASGSILVPTVPVGNPGNPSDPFGGLFRGSVAYEYSIGATEVTNSQYAAFLNAVAADDPNGLYNVEMGAGFGGIARAGASGSYIYAAINGRENHPVNYVSFWDAARFANWMHNGQPTGPQSGATTEDGAYTLASDGISGNTITRNAGWGWAVASEDEWYKAAYHQPASDGGDADDYWAYPTSSNTIGASDANYNNPFGDMSPVGSFAPNYYGAFDMGGNVWEWTDEIQFVTRRGLRGASYDTPAGGLQSANGGSLDAPIESVEIGFRVVQLPAPSTGAMFAAFGIGVFRRWR